jgi:hypothetical protein
MPTDPQPTLFTTTPSAGEVHVSTQLAPEMAPEIDFGTVPIIEVTAQLVDALERGDPQAKVYVEKLLEKYVDLYGEAGAANFQRAFEGVTRAKRQRLPDRIPQQTSQEVRSLAVAISDGHTLTRWEEVLGEVALRHVIAEEPFQVKFTPGPALMAWTGAELSEEVLREELGKCDLDAVLLFYETLGSAIAHLEGGESLYVTVSLDDLILALGWDKAARRNAEERNKLRLKLWHWVMVFDGMKVIGQRPGKYRDPDTRRLLDLTSEDALIRVMGQRVSEDVRTPDDRPMPLEITFAAGPWVERFKGNRQILTEFGNVRVLARIPSGKAAGAWARCIGMTLYQRWREGASRATVIENGTQIVRWKPFTRRGLLTGLFRAQPDVIEMLEGPNPMRAREYWDQAIQMLKLEGFIDKYSELESLPKSRKAWQEAWLDQPLEIMPGDEPLEAAEEIMKSAQAFKSRGKKKRSRPPKKAVPTD